MGKAPAFQMYPGDARRDVELHMMTFEARGVWWEMLLCMWDARERGKLEGTVEGLARLVGCTEEQLKKTVQELSVTKTADVTQCNDSVTIINRRMFRDEKQRKLTRSRVQRHRDCELQRTCNDDVTRPSSSSNTTTSSSNTKRIKKHIGRSPNPDVKKVIDFYFQEFKARFGSPPVIEGGKDGKIISGLLETFPPTHLISLLMNFFDSEDKFVRESGYTLGVFKSQIQKLSINTKAKRFQGLQEFAEEGQDGRQGQKRICGPDALNEVDPKEQRARVG